MATVLIVICSCFSYLLVTTSNNFDPENRPSQSTLIDTYGGNIIGTSFTAQDLAREVERLQIQSRERDKYLQGNSALQK